MMLEDIFKKEKKWKKRGRVKLQKYLSLSISLSLHIYIYIYIYHNPNSKISHSLIRWFLSQLTVAHSQSHSDPPLTHGLTQSPSPSLSFTHRPIAACHGGARISWWLLFVTEEHEIVRSERDMMIGGALGRVEVRRNPEVGLMAETSSVGALVVWVFPSSFLGSFDSLNTLYCVLNHNLLLIDLVV